MASNQIQMGVNFRKNINTKSAANGKYYAEVDRQKTLTTRGLAAQHLPNLFKNLKKCPKAARSGQGKTLRWGTGSQATDSGRAHRRCSMPYGRGCQRTARRDGLPGQRVP